MKLGFIKLNYSQGLQALTACRVTGFYRLAVSRFLLCGKRPAPQEIWPLSQKIIGFVFKLQTAVCIGKTGSNPNWLFSAAAESLPLQRPAGGTLRERERVHAK